MPASISVSLFCDNIKHMERAKILIVEDEARISGGGDGRQS